MARRLWAGTPTTPASSARRATGFLESLSWKADDEPSAYGAVLAAQRLNDRAGFNALVSKWRAKSPRIADVADGRTPASDRRSVRSEASDTTGAMTAPASPDPSDVGARRVDPERQAQAEIPRRSDEPPAFERTMPDETVTPARRVGQSHGGGKLIRSRREGLYGHAQSQHVIPGCRR